MTRRLLTVAAWLSIAADLTRRVRAFRGLAEKAAAGYDPGREWAS